LNSINAQNIQNKKLIKQLEDMFNQVDKKYEKFMDTISQITG